jgi:DNA-binding CsgD family transcriptional regulator
MVPLTSRLERTFASRYADLPGPTRDVILCAAVNDGDELSEALLAASVVAGRPVTLEDVDRAVEAGLVQVADSRVRFRHPLVRSGVFQLESAARHHHAHAALAQVVAAEPYRRTWHRAHSIIGPDDEVADELEANHDIAIQRGSAAAAIWSLERSAQLSTDPTKVGLRLLLAAEHAFEIGRADMVDRLLAAASRCELGPLDLARMEWLREIFNDGVPGDAARVHQLCAVARRSSAAGDESLALNLLMGAALRCWWADTGPDARAAVADTTRSMPTTGHDPRHVAALAVAEPVRMAGAVTRSLSAVGVETVNDANALRLLGMAAHAIGDAVRSIDLLERAARKLREQARLGLLSHVLTMQILDRLELGDWAQAEANAEEGRRLAHDTGQPIWDTGTMSLTAVILALKGDNEQAQDLAARAEYEANGRRLNNLLACVQLARGLGWTAARNFEEAYRSLAPMFDPRSPSFHLTERYHAVMFLAEAAAPAGRLDHARQVLAEMEKVAAVSPAANLHMHLLYARAVLADHDAETLFQAASVADLTRWPWMKARLDLAYGEWLRRRRRVVEARPLLRSASMTLELVGASTWAEQARAELRATGERVASDGASPQDKLSPQELQIARLAAEGLSNREIGQRLYLSPRTVGSHLYRIFPKLGIASRGQLAAVVFQDGKSGGPGATRSEHSDGL